MIGSKLRHLTILDADMFVIYLELLFAAPELLTVNVGGLHFLYIFSENEGTMHKIPSQIMNVRFQTRFAESLVQDTKAKLEAWGFEIAAGRPSLFSFSDDKGGQEWVLTRHNYESHLVKYEPGNQNVFTHAYTSTLNDKAVKYALKSIQETEDKDQSLETYLQALPGRL